MATFRFYVRAPVRCGASAGCDVDRRRAVVRLVGVRSRRPSAPAVPARAVRWRCSRTTSGRGRRALVAGGAGSLRALALEGSMADTRESRSSSSAPAPAARSTALELASAGLDVCVLEEGSRLGARASTAGIARGDAAPVPPPGNDAHPGPRPHRLRRGRVRRRQHRDQQRLLAPHAARGAAPLEGAVRSRGATPRRARAALRVGRGAAGRLDLPRPPCRRARSVFARGIEAMGWAAQEVPRAAPGCKSTNACAAGCPTGAKQGMSRARSSRKPKRPARASSPTARVQLLLAARRARHRRPRGGRSATTARASSFASTPSTSSSAPARPRRPALLRRSGIKHHVGDSLRIHPMLKVAARLPRAHRRAGERAAAHPGEGVLAGDLARRRLLHAGAPGDDAQRQLARDARRDGRATATWPSYYVAVRGSGRRVRAAVAARRRRRRRSATSSRTRTSST